MYPTPTAKFIKVSGIDEKVLDVRIQKYENQFGGMKIVDKLDEGEYEFAFSKTLNHNNIVFGQVVVNLNGKVGEGETFILSLDEKTKYRCITWDFEIHPDFEYIGLKKDKILGVLPRDGFSYAFYKEFKNDMSFKGIVEFTDRFGLIFQSIGEEAWNRDAPNASSESLMMLLHDNDGISDLLNDGKEKWVLFHRRERWIKTVKLRMSENLYSDYDHSDWKREVEIRREKSGDYSAVRSVRLDKEEITNSNLEFTDEAIEQVLDEIFSRDFCEDFAKTCVGGESELSKVSFVEQKTDYKNSSVLYDNILRECLNREFTIYSKVEHFPELKPNLMRVHFEMLDNNEGSITPEKVNSNFSALTSRNDLLRLNHSESDQLGYVIIDACNEGKSKFNAKNGSATLRHTGFTVQTMNFKQIGYKDQAIVTYLCSKFFGLTGNYLMIEGNRKLFFNIDSRFSTMSDVNFELSSEYRQMFNVGPTSFASYGYGMLIRAGHEIQNRFDFESLDLLYYDLRGRIAPYFKFQNDTGVKYSLMSYIKDMRHLEEDENIITRYFWLKFHQFGFELDKSVPRLFTDCSRNGLLNFRNFWTFSPIKTSGRSIILKKILCKKSEIKRDHCFRGKLVSKLKQRVMTDCTIYFSDYD